MFEELGLQALLYFSIATGLLCFTPANWLHLWNWILRTVGRAEWIPTRP